VSYTGNWVCDIALIGCTLGLGKTQGGVGIPEGRVQGANGGQRESVYEQPGIEVDDSYHSWREPSKYKGNTARGI
jgi:hypothetical protein